MYLQSWKVMRDGGVDEALRQMRDNYAEETSASCTNELGVAYLWLRDYESAWEHFNAANQRQPLQIADFYGMAGVAKWCLNDADEAVRQWRAGLDCEFADWAGGVKLPLLLYFASVVKPGMISRTDSEQIVAERADDPRAQMWPGPLGEFVLGRIDESRLRELCFDEKYEDETMLHHWSADFFVGVMERARGNVTRFQQLIHKVGTASWQEFDECEVLFLHKLWSEEFFLARFESERSMAA